MRFIIAAINNGLKTLSLMANDFLLLKRFVNTMSMIISKQNSKVKNVLEAEAYCVAEVLIAILDAKPAMKIS